MNFKKQRGDAVILLSVLVSGLVILISAIAADNIKKSAKIQGIQKKSLTNLYRAEGGIEYGLYMAKNSISNLNQNSANAQFRLRTWVKNPDGSTFTLLNDNAADSTLSGSTPKDSIVISSTSEIPRAEEDQNMTERTLISNIPNSFPGQNVLWNQFRGCENITKCPTDDYSGAGNDKLSYQLAVNMASFDTRQINNPEYKLVFRCHDRTNCKMGIFDGGQLNNEVLIRYSGSSAGCDFSTCAFFCDSEETFLVPLKNNSVNFGMPTISQIISSEWFQPSSNLGGKNIIVEFDVEEAGKGVEETILSDDVVKFDSGIKMCKKKGSEDHYQSFINKRAGLVKVMVREKRN